MSSILAITYAHTVAVTASDTVADKNGPFAGFIVQVAGLVKYTSVDGSTDTIQANAGVIYPIQIQRIWSSTTAATGISGCIAALGP